MNIVLMFVIMGLIGRFKALGGSFRNLKFDLLYKYMYTHKACKFQNLKSPTGSVWHTRVLPRIAAQQYGDKNKLKWLNKFYYFLQFARVFHVPNKPLGTRQFKFASETAFLRCL